MTNYTPHRCTHKTVTGNAVDTVTLSGGHQGMLVINRDTTGILSCRWDGTAAAALADENYVVLPGYSQQVPTTATTVSITSATDCAYSVEGID